MLRLMLMRRFEMMEILDLLLYLETHVRHRADSLLESIFLDPVFVRSLVRTVQ
jgi:hypothetical protein